MFSVITPSYNNLHHIKKCIGSVKSQKNIFREHIIMDAVSDDGTIEYLKKLKILNNEDSSYKIISNFSKDKGMYDAINKGWLKSKGEILCWLNCDEQYLPNTLSYVMNVFQNNPDIDVVYGNAIIVNENGDLISARKELPLNKFLISNTFLNIFSCTIFFRRSLCDKGILGLDEQYRYSSDMELILRLLNNNAKMFHSKKFLSLFSVDGKNLSSQAEAFNETIEIQNKFSRLPKNKRNYVKYLRSLLRFVNGHYLKKSIKYSYAIDDIPQYNSLKGTSNGTFRF